MWEMGTHVQYWLHLCTVIVFLQCILSTKNHLPTAPHYFMVIAIQYSTKSLQNCYTLDVFMYLENTFYGTYMNNLS